MTDDFATRAGLRERFGKQDDHDHCVTCDAQLAGEHDCYSATPFIAELVARLAKAEAETAILVERTAERDGLRQQCVKLLAEFYRRGMQSVSPYEDDNDKWVDPFKEPETHQAIRGFLALTERTLMPLVVRAALSDTPTPPATCPTCGSDGEPFENAVAITSMGEPAYCTDPFHRPLHVTPTEETP